MATRQETRIQSPPKRSTWGTFRDFMQNPLVQLLSPFVCATVMWLGNWAVGYWNFLGLEGRFVQDERRRKKDKEEFAEYVCRMEASLAEISRRQRAHKFLECSASQEERGDNSEYIAKWQGLRNRHCTSSGNNGASSSANSTSTGSGNCASGRDSEGLGGPPRQVNVQTIIPDSSKSDHVVVDIPEKQFGPSDFNCKGSRILQSKVSLDEDILDKIQNVAEECTAVDNGISVQLDKFRVFFRTADNRVEMKTLDDSHEVPVILHSVYAAGKLTIEGLNLENTTIKAATLDECITLKNIEHPHVSGGLQVCTWNVELPSRNFEEVAVYAVKTIRIDDQEVSVCSSVVKVQDNNLRAVIRIGIPTLILIIYSARQLYFAIQLLEWSNLEHDQWMLVCSMVAIFSQLLPPRIDNLFRAWLERVRLISWALYFSMRSFLFKQYPREIRQKHEKKPLDGDSKESNDGANDNFEAGKELSTESTNPAFTGSLQLFTDAFTKLNDTLSEIKRTLQDHEDDPDEKSKDEDEISKDELSEEGEKDSEPVIDQNWQWQAQEEYRTRAQRIKLRKCGDHKKEDAPIKTWIPFDVVYGLKEKAWYARDYINISSPLLMEIILRLVPELDYDLKVFTAALFNIRKQLGDIRLNGVDAVLPGIAQSSEAERVKQQLHVTHLLRFIQTELKDVSIRYSDMEAGGYVTWDMLCAFFTTGTEVAYRCEITGEEVLGTVTTATYKEGRDLGPYFHISIKMWDYNCSTWKSYKTSRNILKFDGECEFTTLQAFPLRFQNDPKAAEKEFLSKGETFCYLSMQVRNRFMNYKGLIYRLKQVGGCMMLQKEDASGRVMVDLASFHKMNPSYPMQNAEPPCEVLRDNKVETIDITSRDDRMYAPAMVYGFSFRLKEWGTFQICGFSEIVFNDSAFDALVMTKPRKQLVETLVREYVQKKKTVATDRGSEQAQQAEQVDPIESKGEGCIILCYGGPGTGKTLTAESLSESLHAPLWSLSVSELGTTPQQLEAYLVKVLGIATTWGAILLLDEADVYLEKRSGFDLTRTAMTGIFLRNLEYYQGVLFLTTNRVVAFDDAFRSRISMILYYEIKKDERRKIWEVILNLVNVTHLPEQVVDKFSEKELNGREIRNVVHRAMILAKCNGDRLNETYIQQSLDDVVLSLEKLALNHKADESPMPPGLA